MYRFEDNTFATLKAVALALLCVDPCCFDGHTIKPMGACIDVDADTDVLTKLLGGWGYDVINDGRLVHILPSG